MKHRCIALLLVCALCAGLFSGCGVKTASGGNRAPSKKEASDSPAGSKTTDKDRDRDETGFGQQGAPRLQGDPDPGQEDSPGFLKPRFSFAVDGCVLARQSGPYADRKYSYNDAGLCVRISDASGDSVSFSYDCDDAGRPLVRYVERDGARSVCETCEYDGSGRLRRLSLFSGDPFDEPDESPSRVWEYDEKGRAVSYEGPDYFPPRSPAFPSYRIRDIRWDDNDRMLGAVFLYEETFDMLLARNPDLVSSAGLEDFIRANDIPSRDGLYTLETWTLDFEYDSAGRLTRYASDHAFTPLGFYLTTGLKSETRTQRDVIALRYSEDEIAFKFRSDRLIGNKLQSDTSTDIDLSYEIERDPAGLPVSVEGESTDVYDLLEGKVRSAQVGLFGIMWCPSALNCFGELHGGFIGQLPTENAVYILSGCMQALRVVCDDGGDEITYYLWPDQFGRQRCQKLRNGLFALDCSTEMDNQRRLSYVVDDVSDTFVYRRLRGGL